MSDGLQTPPRPDGMACFQNNDGTITLIKNHEIGSRRLPSSYDSNLPKSISYDTNFAGVPYTGGTTNLVLDPKSLKKLIIIEVLLEQLIIVLVVKLVGAHGFLVKKQGWMIMVMHLKFMQINK